MPSTSGSERSANSFPCNTGPLRRACGWYRFELRRIEGSFSGKYHDAESVTYGEFPESIVSAALGVAGEVIEGFGFAENGDIDGGAEGLLQLIEGGDLVTQQQRAQFIGAEGERSHKVIVPTGIIPPTRNHNNTEGRSPLLIEAGRSLFLRRVQTIWNCRDQWRSEGPLGNRADNSVAVIFAADLGSQIHPGERPTGAHSPGSE